MRLLREAGIVRHRGKIEAAIHNARRALELIDAFGSLAANVWQFEPDASARPKRLTLQALRRLTTSPEAIALSADLRQRG